MIDIFAFNGFSVGVFGLGRTGISVAEALKRSNAEVWAWDDDPSIRKSAMERGINVVDLYNKDLSELTTLVLSPGIAHTFPKPHAIVSIAKEKNIEIISDIELLGRSQRLANMVGITGTNGKSTTTSLIGHIMQLSGQQVEVGGNLGPPVLDLEGLGDGGTYVIEMSSYQLELTLSITFDVAVLLNISPEHLDRHGSIEGYVTAKKSIFHRQTKPRSAVIAIDDRYTKKIYSELSKIGDQLIIPVSGESEVVGGVYVLDRILIDDSDGKKVPVCDLSEIPSLAGTHNAQNAAASYAACKAVGIEPRVIMACLRSYPGLAHRQEVFEVVDGIIFINDSKATNSEAAARALACYENIFWIVGGRPKKSGLDECEQYFSHVQQAYLIGEASLGLSQLLNGKIKFTISGDIKSAILQAISDIAERKVSQPVVLLSPACASFDQFSNFEDRGDYFKSLVEELPGKHQDPFEEPGLVPSLNNKVYKGAPN